MNASLISKCIVVAIAAVVSLSFTSSPSVSIVPVAATWEAVVADLQGPQGPAKKKVAEDNTTLFGIDDLGQSNWPGLGAVGGLGTLDDSPMTGEGGGTDGSGGPGGGGGGNGMASPKVPEAPWTPGGRLLPPAPTAPLSPFMP